MLDILASKMKDINLNMSRDVVAYFEAELEKAAASLEMAENEMKIFRAENLLNF